MVQYIIMGKFNRGRSGGGFERRSFNDRGSRGPAQMHQAVCDNCRKECEVPFRPTSGKPIFCSSCFENNRGSDSRRFEGRHSDRANSLADKQMFDAVCDECGNSCKVPFQPTSGKPIFCSSCFENKQEGSSRNREQFQSPSKPQYTEQFTELNNKLDKILLMLAPNAFEKVAFATETVEEEQNQQLEEEAVNVEEKVKVAKKKSSKKK